MLVKPETRNFLRYWLPAILWIALVLLGSAGWFSGRRTGGILAAVLFALFGPISPEYLAIAHFLARKLAHLSEYGILAWLLYRARGQTQTVWNLSWARFALVGVLIVATVDELHQHFVPSRSGSPIDVAIDVGGALFALLIVRRISHNRRHTIPAAANTTN